MHEPRVDRDVSISIAFPASEIGRLLVFCPLMHTAATECVTTTIRGSIEPRASARCS
jgi:hypothetical protein